MSSDITKYFGPNSPDRPSQEPGTIVRRREGYNGKNGAYKKCASTNNGLVASRTTTEMGTGIDTIIKVQQPRNRAERDAGIVDLHNNDVDQQTIADAYNCSQSTVSRVLNKNKKKP